VSNVVGGSGRDRHDDEWLVPLVKATKRWWLRRIKGEVALAAVLDTFDATEGFETRNGQAPILVKSVKTDYGRRLIWHLPAGIPSKRVTENLEAFEEQVNGSITIERHGADLFMDVATKPLDTNAPYTWQPPENGKGTAGLIIPIGITYTGLVTVELTTLPDLLIAGNKGGGKTTALRVVAYSCLLQGAVVLIIDLKGGTDFGPFERHCPLAVTEPDALRMLALLNGELRRRFSVLRAAQVEKAQDYKGSDMPWIVLIIDELAEIRDKATIKELDSLMRLARAVGISVVAATQRPAHDILPKFSNLRMLFSGRLVFTMPKEEDSRIILGNDMASRIPRNIPGRAIWQWESDGVEVQCLNLSFKEAQKRLKGLPHRVDREPEFTEGVFAIERRPARLPPR
jgi:S-DNA-T family DNA segregation ATPase FtsK/SpoIIIE